jgi:hypothetical protein
MPEPISTLPAILANICRILRHPGTVCSPGLLHLASKLEKTHEATTLAFSPPLDPASGRDRVFFYPPMPMAGTARRMEVSAYSTCQSAPSSVTATLWVPVGDWTSNVQPLTLLLLLLKGTKRPLSRKV